MFLVGSHVWVIVLGEYSLPHSVFSGFRMTCLTWNVGPIKSDTNFMLWGFTIKLISWLFVLLAKLTPPRDSWLKRRFFPLIKTETLFHQISADDINHMQHEHPPIIILNLSKSKHQNIELAIALQKMRVLVNTTCACSTLFEEADLKNKKKAWLFLLVHLNNQALNWST